MIPLIWLIAGVVLIIAEVVSGELVLLMLGGAALVTAAASGLGVPLGPDIAVYGVAAAALVLLLRPALTRRLRVADPVNTGTRALLGASAEVLEPIGTGDDAVGTVRVDGAVWTARSWHGDTEHATGSSVVVVEIAGATAVVTAMAPDRPGTTPGTSGGPAETGET